MGRPRRLGTFSGRIVLLGFGSIGQAVPTTSRCARTTGWMDAARPYLGEVVGVWGDWTPLAGRTRLFPEPKDPADPWQFVNFRMAWSFIVPVLLEAQRVGWGASGRNGGQALVGYGSDGEEAIERQFGRAEARRAWDVTVEAMRLLHQRIARHAIACEWQPGYLGVATKPRKAQELRRWTDHVRTTYDYPLQWIDDGALRGWVDSPRFHAAAYDAGSGHLPRWCWACGTTGCATRCSATGPGPGTAVLQARIPHRFPGRSYSGGARVARRSHHLYHGTSACPT
jgi:hypothetical protein